MDEKKMRTNKKIDKSGKEIHEINKKIRKKKKVYNNISKSINI